MLHVHMRAYVFVCVNMIAHKDVSSNDFKITTHNLDPPSMCHNFCSKISEENSNCRSKNQRQIDKTFGQWMRHSLVKWQGMELFSRRK